MTFSGNPASFRDPSGFVFKRDGVLYRQINEVYREDFIHLMKSGLYDDLVSNGFLVAHEEISPDDGFVGAYKVIKPLAVPFVSYPHEWCFSQLKDSAFLTLEIQKRALAFGMSLKDASAFNIQFIEGRPVFIDTLSFERYEEGAPWVAFRQFCMHFLAPLALMSYCDIRLNAWFRVSVDGVPLDLAASLLPFRTRFSPSISMHIHMHARSQKRHADRGLDKKKPAGKVSKFALLALVDNLEGAIRRLTWKPEDTEWANYYQDTNYSSQGTQRKRELVAEYLKLAGTGTVWDLGANDGTFSRIAAKMGFNTVSFDIDPACVEKNYLKVKAENERLILPLLQDLTNPSPGMGWAGSERSSLAQRGLCHTALALALLHHLAISNNVPLGMIAEYLASLCCWLVIEFVPKEDSQVLRLLATRKDIFDKYSAENFENAFKRHFNIIKKATITDSARLLYLMKREHPVSGDQAEPS